MRDTTTPDGSCQGTNPRYCGTGRQRRAHAPGDPSGVNTGWHCEELFLACQALHLVPCAMCIQRLTATTQPCTIWYFAKSASTRLKALSIAWAGVMPLLMTSNIATLQTCSVSTSAMAGLKK